MLPCYAFARIVSLLCMDEKMLHNSSVNSYLQKGHFRKIYQAKQNEIMSKIWRLIRSYWLAIHKTLNLSSTSIWQSNMCFWKTLRFVNVKRSNFHIPWELSFHTFHLWSFFLTYFLLSKCEWFWSILFISLFIFYLLKC